MKQITLVYIAVRVSRELKSFREETKYCLLTPSLDIHAIDQKPLPFFKGIDFVLWDGVESSGVAGAEGWHDSLKTLVGEIFETVKEYPQLKNIRFIYDFPSYSDFFFTTERKEDDEDIIELIRPLSEKERSDFMLAIQSYYNKED